MEDAVVGDHGPQPSFQAALTVEVCELLAEPLERGYPLGQRRESALGNAAAGGADVDGHQPVDSGPVPLRTADLVAGALGRDPCPDVALLVPVETRRAHRHAEQEHRQLAAAELGIGDCLLAGRLLQQVTAVVVEQGVGDLHRGGAAEGCLFRLVDASRPGSEDAGVDQLVQGSVQSLRRVRARGPVPQPPPGELSQEGPLGQFRLLGDQHWEQMLHGGGLRAAPVGEPDEALRPFVRCHVSSSRRLVDQEAGVPPGRGRRSGVEGVQGEGGAGGAFEESDVAAAGRVDQ
ncbi:hypothetical protein EES47_19440 [Streptomyces sp. ADI98-12]|nr:hypothetical protein EES47_19440 [Streptomyces sp. ADI98-12]